ncbi:DNA polymerase Y family protein [Youngiibacter fragilis]|uniref:DNA polymerase IV n=1 Tax=Youngiibacter fragilis 232.1 TaxID=994573 RepID=V7HZ70_9CLOT|nr:DNA polymerase IV [Youngiibacter fragilis]ETA78923.1 DNA polymerase IV [Youngiibacter fragilis 232.1]
MEKVVFHVDVNSAYLSWSAVWDLQHGAEVDLREIPAIVGGNPETRHGIVLAKSIPSKKYGIKTGETLFSAFFKCPNLTVVPPKYSQYLKASNAMVEVLREYSPIVERYSVDECFMDMGNITREEAVSIAARLKDRISEELGFTVNVGVSDRKLLAKMGSDLKKPDMVHTLFPDEIEEKMWPLPVEDMFMVGPATTRKLKDMNIRTIGELAAADPKFLHEKFKKYGLMISAYSRGLDISTVKAGTIPMKGMGNSTTLPFDFTDRISCHNVMLSLCETLMPRLRDAEKLAKCVAVHIRGTDLVTVSRQTTLYRATDSTTMVMETACSLFDSLWDGSPVRHLGIALSQLKDTDVEQLCLLKSKSEEKSEKIDRVIDTLRKNFGDNSVIRATFLNSPVGPFSGGVEEKDYVFMSSLL